MKHILFCAMALITFTWASAATGQQGKKVTLDQIESGEFSALSVYGLNHSSSGQSYTTLTDGRILRHSYTDANVVDTLLDPKRLAVKLPPIAGYTMSENEAQILLFVEPEPIYRHSFKANYWVYDTHSRNLKPLSKGGKQQVATISPDGRKAAFVRDNNIFTVDFVNSCEKQITNDGVANEVINGSTDWVYEEEFGFDRGYQWSPASDAIAFYRFDESRVKRYSMNVFGNGLYPVNHDFKYPKAGEENSFVRINVYNVTTGKTVPMEIGTQLDQYIPRIKWTGRPDELAIYRLNRLQNSFQVLLASGLSGKSRVVYNEQDEKYVENVNDSKVTFLADGKRFIVTSERDGWNHLYLYDMNGRQLSQLTKGQWEVTSLNGIDLLGGRVYYTSTEGSELGRSLYSVDLKGGRKRKILGDNGTYESSFSGGACNYFINYFSSNVTPTQVAIYESKNGNLVRVLEDNKALQERIETYEMPHKEFFKFTTQDGVELNGYLLLPTDFDSTKCYPLLMTQYSGPGSQQVANKWGLGWEASLLEEGFLVACIDGRGTGFRGREFRQYTYGNLGGLEIQDQRQAALYLGDKHWIAKDKIAIFGWSFGGFMALNGILKHGDIFAAAVAVAPVTSWRFYDTIYTERYNGLPSNNPDGYDLNSPLFFADSLQGKLLLVHGTGDDNVHIQNSYAMINALVAKGKEFEMMIYPDKNHGMAPGNESRGHLYRRAIRFLKDNLQ